MMTGQVEQAISELNGLIGTPIEFDENGVACLLFDDDTILSLRYHSESNAFDLYGFLPFVPESLLRELSLELLDANFLWKGTAGATLGRDADSGRCALCYRVAADGFSGTALLNLLADFSECLDGWANRIRQALSTDSSTLPNSSPLASLEENLNRLV